MRIVITGAAGFLGSELRRVLLGFEQIEVIGVTRLRIPGMLTVDNYEDTPTGDILVHLAESSERMVANFNGEAYEQEVKQLLEKLGKKRFKRIVYASSAVLYGDQNTRSCIESDPIHLTDSYTRIKNISEDWVVEHGGIVARLSNLYGPGMSDKNVLGTILSQLANTGPIIVNDTKPIRDFLWIEDAAKALAIMVTGQMSGTFNIGSGVGISILQLANSTLEAAGLSGRQVLSRTKSVSCSNLVLDITKASTKLGWYPSIDLKQGIVSMLNIGKNRLELC